MRSIRSNSFNGRCGALSVVLFVALTALPPFAFAQTTSSDALRAFDVVRSVFQHPRCQNCHIPGDAPLQYDDSRTHLQFVKRGSDGRGAAAMECSSCHREENLPSTYGDNAPPGAPNWHLPPPTMKMVFIGLSPRQLCETIKNPQATGGKDLRAMLTHVRDDKLVAWGWSPGGRRTLPPASRDDTVAAFKAWMDAGAPCPSS